MSFKNTADMIVSAAVNFVREKLGIVREPTTALDWSKFNPVPVFADEFDGDSLNTEVWTAHGADRSVRRGSYWDMEMASVKDGCLHIKSQYLKDGLNGNPAGWYTVGMDTRNSFNGKYGYYECRCILPEGCGLWGAFWLFCDEVNHVDGTGTNGAEIDVVESPYWSNKKLRNSTIHTIHYDGYAKAHRSKNDGHWRIPGDPYHEFHTYGVEWNEDGYTFYIDGKKTSHTAYGGVSNVPEFVILSVEIDGLNAKPANGWSGPHIENNPGGKDFTVDFVVDYVRVYEYR